MRSAMGRSSRAQSEANATGWYSRPGSAFEHSRAVNGFLGHPNVSMRPRSASRTYLSAPFHPASVSPMSTPSIPANAFNPAMVDQGNSMWFGSEGLQLLDGEGNGNEPLEYLAQVVEGQDEASHHLRESLLQAGVNFEVPAHGQGTDRRNNHPQGFPPPLHNGQLQTGPPPCICQQKILEVMSELSRISMDRPLPLPRAVSTNQVVVETCSAAIRCIHHQNGHDNLTFFLSLVSLLIHAANISDVATVARYDSPSDISAPKSGFGSGSSVDSAHSTGDLYGLSSVDRLNLLAPSGPMQTSTQTGPPTLPTSMGANFSHPMIPGPAALGPYQSGEAWPETGHWRLLWIEMSKVQHLTTELERRFATPHEERANVETRVVSLLLGDLKRRLRKTDEALRGF